MQRIAWAVYEEEYEQRLINGCYSNGSWLSKIRYRLTYKSYVFQSWFIITGTEARLIFALNIISFI